MTAIGATLREARMRASLEIAEFEARTKIRAKFLRALEDEQWDVLPGYAYTKGFLRTYADMLGLDGQMLVDEFKRQHPDPTELTRASLPPPRHDTPLRDRPRERAGERGRKRAPGRSRRSSSAAAAVVLVILLAVALYTVGQLGSSKSTSLTTATHTTTTNTTTATTRTHTTPHRPTVPARVALQLVPTGPVYVCLIGYRTATDSHPQLRINAILTPASPRLVYHADNHFLVTFGNNLIRMLIDGHRHTVPATPTVVVSYEIQRGGAYHQVPPSAAPHCP